RGQRFAKWRSNLSSTARPFGGSLCCDGTEAYFRIVLSEGDGRELIDQLVHAHAAVCSQTAEPVVLGFGHSNSESAHLNGSMNSEYDARSLLTITYLLS